MGRAWVGSDPAHRLVVIAQPDQVIGVKRTAVLGQKRSQLRRACDVGGTPGRIEIAIGISTGREQPFHDLGVAGACRRVQRDASGGVGAVRPVRVGAAVQKQSDDVMVSELDGRR